MSEASILQLLEKIRVLLEKHQVTYWAGYFEELEQEYLRAKQLRLDWRHDELIDEMSDLFGGMGSFNDYVITAQHGDMISKRQELVVNRTLNELRHQLAVAIRRKKEGLS